MKQLYLIKHQLVTRTFFVLKRLNRQKQTTLSIPDQTFAASSPTASHEPVEPFANIKHVV